MHRGTSIFQFKPTVCSLYQGGEDGSLSSRQFVLGTLELNLSYDREDQSIGLLNM